MGALQIQWNCVSLTILTTEYFWSEYGGVEDKKEITTFHIYSTDFPSVHRELLKTLEIMLSLK